MSQPTAGPSTAEQGGRHDEDLAPAPLEKSPHGPSSPSNEESMGQEDITLEPESGALPSQELVIF